MGRHGRSSTRGARLNLRHVQEAVDAAVEQSDDPAVRTRVLVIYLAPDGGGLFIHRVGVGSHLIGDSPDEDFSTSMMRAVERLWPESSPKVRQWMRIAAHTIARMPLAKMMVGGGDDED